MPKLMRCADCGLRWRLFAAVSEGDYCCRKCGYLQTSTAAGAADLCESATWHSLEGYARYRAVALSGGFEVPEQPLNFEA